MRGLIARFMNPGEHSAGASLGLLLLRLVFGGLMIVNHGWGKLSKFSELSGKFPDPLGVGSTASLSMAIFGEVVCAGLLVLGFLTRGAAIPAMVTMGVAAFVVHGADPLAKKEMALLYLAAFTALLALGAGRYSVDGTLRR